MSDIKNTNFGVYIRPEGGTVGDTINIDYIALKIRYSTYDILQLDVQLLGDLEVETDSYISTTNNTTMHNKMSHVLDYAANDYTYGITHIRCVNEIHGTGELRCEGTTTKKSSIVKWYKK